jgi:hypothetical protein
MNILDLHYDILYIISNYLLEIQDYNHYKNLFRLCGINKYFRTLILDKQEELYISNINILPLLINKFKNIKKVKILNSIRISTLVFDNFLNTNKNITDLSLYNLYDNDINIIIKNCKNLNKIYFHSKHLNDNSLYNLCNTYENLKCLYLPELSNITYSSLEYLFNKYTYLEEIDLSFNKTITDNIIDIITLNNGMNLKSIFINSCVNITDMALFYLSTRCKDISILNISNNINITNVSMKYISNLHKLTILHVSKCNIDDIGLYEICLNCPLINILFIPDTNITDLSIKNIVSNLNLIKILNISNCIRLTNESIKLLENKYKLPTMIFIYRIHNITVNISKLFMK